MTSPGLGGSSLEIVDKYVLLFVAVLTEDLICESTLRRIASSVVHVLVASATAAVGEAEGETDGDALGLSETEADGLTLGLRDADGLTLGD